MQQIITILPFLYIPLCLGIGYLGKKRKGGFWVYFLVSFLLTPLIGLLVLYIGAPKSTEALSD
ncbi:uncharacterized protein METZ01_LOCUS305649 [marine metagenome]|uniref:Uncharacterized protein n=1 Tax=marine metagenome TaxID=408172 RepID=A0A382MXE4_9ZZZZ